MLRIITGAVLLVILWASVVPAPRTVFVAMALLAISIANWECYRMLRQRCDRPLRWMGIVTSWAVVWSFVGQPPTYDVVLPLVLLVITSTTLVMWRRSTPAEMLESVCSTLFPVFFISLTLGHLVALRCLPGDSGKAPLMMLFICVILGDTVAFYVGSTFGRHKLAPSLSPKKSWEGALGGVAASVIGALIAHFWFYPELPLGHAVILGVLLGLAGIQGDLAASLVKRASGVKDSSRLLPGHGGLLDRTDSLLFAGPILYYYYVMVLQG